MNQKWAYLLSVFFLLFAKCSISQSLLQSGSFSTTEHQISIEEDLLKYQAKTGYLFLYSEDEEPQAKVFCTAYLKQGVENKQDRPITFVFNGGPGSSSVWLHMGGLGPQRVELESDGSPSPPPYGYQENPYTWLDLTDLVFIDPMMTGYTRPMGETKKEEFLGFQPDLELVGAFIHKFLTLEKRWGSPKFLAGESYGTTRAAGLSNYLQQRYGLYLNGIALISAVLDFSTLIEVPGHDLPPLTILPTMAATAWFHGQANPRFSSLEAIVQEAESFAMGEYASALLKGSQLSGPEEARIAQKLHELTGLDTAYLSDVNYRLSVGSFNKELLREQGKTVGRLDSRFTGLDSKDDGDRYDYDPSYSEVIYGPFTTAIYDYLQKDLNYPNFLPYEILTGRARPWPYGDKGQNRFVNVAEDLRSAMAKNPKMQVWVANGYYDMATPYFATQYTFDHMFLRHGREKNVKMTYYPAGHMMYIDFESLQQLKEDAKSFYQSAK